MNQYVRFVSCLLLSAIFVSVPTMGRASPLSGIEQCLAQGCAYNREKQQCICPKASSRPAPQNGGDDQESEEETCPKGCTFDRETQECECPKR